MAQKKERWYQPGEKLGWRKSDSQDKRRRIALKNRGGDILSTARALGALTNVNSGPKGDKETHRKAKSDSQYFYRLYRKKQKG